MSYFTEAQRKRIRQYAYEHTLDEKWSFLHSMLWFAMQPENEDLVAEMKPTPYHGRDGAFRGLLLINELAELLEIALAARRRKRLKSREKLHDALT